jgi:hypothetical protein
MDHRITIAVVGVFAAVLGFTFLVASLTTTVGPDRAQAVYGSTAGGDGAEELAGPSPRELLMQVLGMLERQAEQWRNDHGGKQPDFAAYPDWQQFIQSTDPDGRPAGSGGPAAAYFSRRPVNPLNGLSTVVMTDKPLRPAQRVPASSGRAGFVYSTADRCYWGTNGTGGVIITRAQPQSPTTEANAH